MRLSSACKDESVLHQFAREQLPQEQSQEAERHILACPRCAALLERQFSSLIEVLRTAGSEGGLLPGGRHAEQERINQLIRRLEELPSWVTTEEEGSPS